MKALDDKFSRCTATLTFGEGDFDQGVWNSLKHWRHLGIKHERAVNIGRHAPGYAEKVWNITTRFATPESVIAHEIGHQMIGSMG